MLITFSHPVFTEKETETSFQIEFFSFLLYNKIIRRFFVRKEIAGKRLSFSMDIKKWKRGELK